MQTILPGLFKEEHYPRWRERIIPLYLAMLEAVCPFLSLSWQKRPGHTGESPVKGTKMVKGLEELTCEEQLRAGTVVAAVRWDWSRSPGSN